MNRLTTPLVVLGLLVGLACAAPASAQEAADDGYIPHETYELDNGLRVILAPDPTATAVAVNIWYEVGSRHERPGRSGFAHLFEHLMFQGSENVPSGEHSRLLSHAGGSYNATVNEDRTIYFQVLPSDRYNLGLWLESDRMRALTVNQENMSNEVEVVKEERRMRVDNQPYGSSSLATMYYLPYNAETCFPYAHSPIGSMEDLDAAELQDVQDFFDLYYAPNNATLALVGSFEVDEAKGLIEDYFGDIQSSPEPPEVICEEPFSHLPVEEVIEDPNAQLPAYWASYGAVEVGHEDSHALSLLASILGQGESSRLNERLVRQEQTALAAGTFAALRRLPGLFIFQGIANQGVEIDEIRGAIDEEIERVQNEGVTADELEKAQNRYRASTIMGRQSVMGRASALQQHNLFFGDPGAMTEELDRHMQVTTDDIQRVAQQYLQPANRVVVITQPATQS